MPQNKYINTKDVVELTGRSTSEVLNLAKSGVLPTHKTRRGHYRFNIEDVEKFFGIQIYNPEEETKQPEKQPKSQSQVRLITEDFFQEVIKRACAAKSSIKIMTADFNRIRLKPKRKQGKNYGDGTPFFDFLMEKANKGVSVEIITAEQSGFFQDDVERANCNTPNKFSVWLCARNHAKVVIIDDKIAYIGSANMTKAGLGQPYCTPGNFEVGILTKEPDIIASLIERFSDIKHYKFCDDCHRKKDCIEYKYYYRGIS